MQKLLSILLLALMVACNNEPKKTESEATAMRTAVVVASPDPSTPTVDSTIVTIGDSAVVTVVRTTYKDVTDTIYYKYKRPETSYTQYKKALNTPVPNNRPPIANAGIDQTIILPVNSTILPGTGSDPDNDPITYLWSNGETKATLTVNNLTEGTYTYTLRVTDSKGNFATDNVIVTVKPAVVTPPPTGTPVPLSFSQLTTDYSRPGAGFEYWYNDFQVSSGAAAQDRYIRFNWAALNPSKGNYNWSNFDQQINIAIDAKQKFSFGMMTQYSGGGGSVGIANYGGANSSYPQWLHNEMMTESVKPISSGGDWVPNYNSNSYLTAYETFCKALYQHLSTTTYKNVLYKNAINSIDIRGYGNFGEWHNWPYGKGSPSTPTVATFKRIIDAHKNGFPDIRLSAMISGVSANDAWSDVTPEVAYYLLTASNQAGEFGIRRDNWGATEAWYNQDVWENNPKSYNGVALKTLIMEKYKKAPITGEPCCNSGYAALPAQALKYHLVSVGNANYGNKPSTSVAASASKNMGYRLSISSGSYIPGSGTISITLNWNSNGTTPVYEDFDCVYELRQGSTVVKSFMSSFKPKLLLGTKAVTDNFTGLPSGTYDLYLVIKNPNGYRQLPLSNQNWKGLLKAGIVL